MLPSTIALLAAAACGGEGGFECPDEIGGVAVVQNGREGLWEQQGRRPSPALLWRRGGTNEGEHLAFPAGAAVSRPGRVAIADFQLAELAVIGADGDWLGPWATRGPGPGELSAPVAAAWISSDTVAVFDIGAAEMEFVAAAGARSAALSRAFVGPVVASGQVLWAAVDATSAAWLKVIGPVDDQGLQLQAIVRHGLGASGSDTLVVARVPVVAEGRFRGSPLPGFPTATAAIGGDLAFLADPEGRYVVTVRDAAGNPVKHICRTAPPWPLTESEVGEDPVPERLSALAQAFRTASRPDRPASIGRLVAGPGRELWVQRERSEAWDDDEMLYGKAGAVHDVFNGDGQYLGTLALPEGFRLQSVLGDTLWGFRRGELGEVWVEAYELRDE